jgi:hypothetical protein
MDFSFHGDTESLMRKICAFILLLTVTLCATCYVSNSNYAVDERCSENNPCPTSVCDVADGVCVQCTPADPGACQGAAPVCGGDHICRGCSLDQECASKVCDTGSGACVAETAILYVEPTGVGLECTRAAPCNTLSQAIGKSSTTRNTLLVGPGSYSEKIAIDDKNLVISAVGADLSAPTAGQIVDIVGASVVTIRGLRIHGGLGTNGDGIRSSDRGGNSPSVTLHQVAIDTNGGKGISASGGSLAVTQSTIRGNAGGGISVGNEFSIVGNFLSGNGGLGTTVGGIEISTTQNANNRLEFNTLNRNGAQDTVGSGIQCVAGTFTARNNIVYGNGTVSNPLQVAGSCLHAYSDIGPTALVGGSNNLNVDPLFVNTTIGDLHILATSPVRGMADPSSNLIGPAAKDIDGQSRSLPADIGADEVNP